MAAPPLRKPNKRLGGKEVRVCGHTLGSSNVICGLPPKHPNKCVGLAISPEGAIITVIMDEKDIDAWQLVGPLD